MALKEIEIRGKVVAIQDGEKKINSNFTSAYRSVRIKVGRKFYRVFLSPTQINKYGVMPKEGMWLRVKGVIEPPKKDFYDPIIKSIKIFEHTDVPILQQIIEKYEKSNNKSIH